MRKRICLCFAMDERNENSLPIRPIRVSRVRNGFQIRIIYRKFERMDIILLVFNVDKSLRNNPNGRGQLLCREISIGWWINQCLVFFLLLSPVHQLFIQQIERDENISISTSSINVRHVSSSIFFCSSSSIWICAFFFSFSFFLFLYMKIFGFFFLSQWTEYKLIRAEQYESFDFDPNGHILWNDKSTRSPLQSDWSIGFHHSFLASFVRSFDEDSDDDRIEYRKTLFELRRGDTDTAADGPFVILVSSPLDLSLDYVIEQ